MNPSKEQLLKLAPCLPIKVYQSDFRLVHTIHEIPSLFPLQTYLTWKECQAYLTGYNIDEEKECKDSIDYIISKLLKIETVTDTEQIKLNQLILYIDQMRNEKRFE